MTVKELKAQIKDLSDDTPVVCAANDMERNGYLPQVSIRVENMVKVQKRTWDRFDGTDYEYDAYERNANGTPTLVIN